MRTLTIHKHKQRDAVKISRKHSKRKYHESAPVHILFLILKRVGVTSPLGAQHIQPLWRTQTQKDTNTFASLRMWGILLNLLESQQTFSRCALPLPASAPIKHVESRSLKVSCLFFWRSLPSLLELCNSNGLREERRSVNVELNPLKSDTNTDSVRAMKVSLTDWFFYHYQLVPIDLCCEMVLRKLDWDLSVFHKNWSLGIRKTSVKPWFHDIKGMKTFRYQGCCSHPPTLNWMPFMVTSSHSWPTLNVFDHVQLGMVCVQVKSFPFWTTSVITLWSVLAPRSPVTEEK